MSTTKDNSLRVARLSCIGTIVAALITGIATLISSGVFMSSSHPENTVKSEDHKLDPRSESGRAGQAVPPKPRPVHSPPSVQEADTSLRSESPATAVEVRSDTPSSLHTSAIAVYEGNGFRIELTSCRLLSIGVRCDLRVTNTGQDASFSIIGHQSFVFDDFGQEARLTAVQIVDKAGPKLLLSGLPSHASVSFGEVSSDSKMLRRFNIYCYRNRTPFEVAFESIPLNG